jgi:FSR family fosmidomycin resistance protein-like MFS transporter
MKTRYIGLLTIAHASADINQGAIPILLPSFIAAHNLSYTAAAAIVFAVNLVSTGAQPLFGYIADRHSSPWVIPLSMVIVGLGVSYTGIAPSYGLGVAAVMMSGLGVAMFHPEGARLMNYLAGERKATAMSLFGVGGQLGFAIGPLIATAALLWWGLKGTLCLIVPPAAVAAAVIAALPGMTKGYASAGCAELGGCADGGSADRWPAFLCLSGALLSRSVVFYGINTFLPLYWIYGLGQSRTQAASALTVFLVATMTGNLFGGRGADRMGYRRVTITGLVLLALFLPLLLVAPTPLTAMLLLAPIGFVLSVPFGPMVVLGQSYLPNRVGLASGITLGLGMSFGGLVTPLLGWVADAYGLRATIAVVAFTPLLPSCSR